MGIPLVLMYMKESDTLEHGGLFRFVQPCGIYTF